MTDESQNFPQQSENLPPPLTSDSAPLQARKSNHRIWIIAAGVIGIACLCSILCIGVFGASMYKVFTERGPIESVLDTYMQYMETKDVDSAYALFSPRAQRFVSIAQVHELVEGNNYIIFEGYQSISVVNLNISAAANSNPDQPQGIVAKVNGIVNYDGGIQGSFNGVLEEIDDKWMIDSMYVTVPPSKIK